MTDAPAAAPSGSPAEALLPCPFCGGMPELTQLTDADNAGGWTVECTGCLCSTRVHFSCKEDARPHVVDAWNSRAVPHQAPRIKGPADLRKALLWYTEQFNWRHLNDCPEDDTCLCPHIAVINAFLRGVEGPAAEGVAAEQIAAWQRLCDAATPGPWTESDDAPGEIKGWLEPDENRSIGKFYGAFADWHPNQRFVCAARQALPLCLAEIARLRQRVEELIRIGEDATAAGLELGRRHSATERDACMWAERADRADATIADLRARLSEAEGSRRNSAAAGNSDGQ